MITNIKRLLIQNRVVDPLLFLGLAIIPFWKTGFTGIFNKLDNVFPLYPLESFYSSIFLWDDRLFSGFYVGAVGDAPRLGILALPAYLGLPVGIIERMYFIAIFFMLGYGMYYLVLTIEEQNRLLIRLGAISAGIFFMLNPYTFFRLQGTHPNFLLASALAPFMFALLIKGFNNAEKYGIIKKSHVLGIALFSLLLFTTGEPLWILIFILLSTYSILRLITGIKEGYRLFIYNLKFLLASILVILSFLASHVIAIFISLSSGLYTEVAARDVNIGVLMHERNINYLNVFRLWPSWLGSLRFPFTFHWNDIFISWPNIILGSSFFIIGLLAFIFRPRDIHGRFLGLLLIIFIPLRMGPNQPFENVFWWLWNNVPFIQAFRDLYRFNMILTLVYALLLGLSVNALARNFLKRSSFQNFFSNKIRKKLFSGIFISLFVVSVFTNIPPILSGNMEGMIEPTELPSYYSEARDFLNNNGDDARILLVPFGDPAEFYTWAPKYDIVSYADRFFQQPVWPVNPVGYGGSGLGGILSPKTRELAVQINQTITDGDEVFKELLAMANIKFIVLRKDVMTMVYREKFEEPIQLALLKAPEVENTIKSQMKLVEIFGDLEIYETTKYYPIVHAPNTLHIVYDWSELLDVLNNVKTNESVATIFRQDISDDTLIQLRQLFNSTIYKDSSLVNINVQKVSPTKYLVDVDTSLPFILVLGDQFHGAWKAKILGFSKNLEHLLMNGYANGWIIPSEGKFTIEIKFEYQDMQDIGHYISLSAIIGVTFYLIVDNSKKR